MATIKEIAELAGVSRGTVDRVLNNRGSVNPKTEQKIRDIARAVQYRPNRAGIVLAAQKRSLKLGVVVFGLANPFFDRVLAGVQEKAEELQCYNCTVLVRQTGASAAEQLAAIDELLAAGVSGLALSPDNSEAVRAKIDALAEQGVPVVTLNTDIDRSKRLAYVGSDYYQSGRIAAGLLHIACPGPTRVAILTGSSSILCHTQRVAGFRAQIAACYPEIEVVGVAENHDDDIESYNAARRLLAAAPQPDALYFAAAGVYGGCRALLASGRQEQVRVIAHDAVPTTEQMIRQGVISATICQQPEQQGRLPLELLFSYLATGERPAQELYYVDSDIRIRENL